VRTLVAVLSPHKGRVYDPCAGSGGMFVQSEKFVESHGGRTDDIAIYGQESNPTTWRLIAMNLAIRGIGFDLGKEPADSFTRDQHPDLKADYVLANPPFNISDWWNASLEGDKRWQYGTPPAGNANFAWLQHILWHLKPTGQAGVVLANGSMSSNQSGEGEIRRRMIEADVVECMVALPPQLFFNTQIPACLWFLTRDKTAHGRNRQGEFPFVDARKLGRLENRVHRVFDDADIQKIASAVHRWRQDGEFEGAYEDVPGFCRGVKLAEIQEHGYVLTPGRYVGAEDIDDDDEAFAEKMERLTAQLAEQMARGEELDAVIRQKLGALGYGI
jgi:type I restriction enzyme M protein